MKSYTDKYPESWFDDFLRENIGKDNPYQRCSYCKISVPEINYKLEGHLDDCEYRLEKELKLSSSVKRSSKIKPIKFKPYPHQIKS